MENIFKQFFFAEYYMYHDHVGVHSSDLMIVQTCMYID